MAFSQLSTFGNLDAAGIFDREMSLYHSLRERGIRIQLLSHGGREEFAYARRLPGLRVLCNWLGLPHPVYQRRLHLLHAPALLRTDILMTHEASALRPALRLEAAWDLPFVFRAGFHWSSNMRVARPDDHDFIGRVEGMERRAMERAAGVIASTGAIADMLIEQAPDAAPKVSVIPNHVDTAAFRPVASEKAYDLVYVGRIEALKNLAALLEAVETLDVTLAIIGGGTVLDGGRDHVKGEEIRLHERFGDLNGRVRWLGRVQNEELPRHLNAARAFILPSLVEGHPRALIEAMACGLPIIGTRVAGIENALRHGDTGYLCEADSESIAAAIQSLLAQPRLMRTLGENARKEALAKFSRPQLARAFEEQLLAVARSRPTDPARIRLAQYLLRR